MELKKKDNNYDLQNENKVLQGKHNNLKEKKKGLESELKNNITQYDDCDQDLIRINYEIDQLNENLQKEINEKDYLNSKGNESALINSEEIKKKCSEFFEEFIMDSHSQSLSVLEFEIRFGKIVIFKEITNKNLTFKELKEETKSQFDREINEFFFLDEKNRVYLDNMNVKRALFPLEKISVKNTMPKILVKDIFNYEIEENYYKTPEIIDKDLIGAPIEKYDLSFIDRINRNFQSYKYIYIKIFLYTLFVIFWILSCIEFRSLKSFFLIQNTFDEKIFKLIPSDVNKLNKIFNFIYLLKYRDLLKNMKMQFKLVFQFPDPDESKKNIYIQNNTNSKKY